MPTFRRARAMPPPSFPAPPVITAIFSATLPPRTPLD
jgi:hypothetical protein